MPTNKNAMTRYKILDDLLSSRYHNYSIDDLVENVNLRLSEMYPDTDGVGRRMIEKDIAYLELEGPFLADIERYSVASYSQEKQKSYTKRCLRYANPSFSIFKKQMSNEEAYLLRETLSMLGQFDGLPNLEVLERLRLGLGVRNDERQIISFTKNPLGHSKLLGELFTAISQRQVVELHYHKFSKKEDILMVSVHPYLLKEYNRRWFLLAAAETDGKILNFALDRIDACKPLPSHKYIEYNGDINERFEDIVGITFNEGSPVYKIIFWVSDISKDYVATKPIHESQRVLPEVICEELRSKYKSLIGGTFFRIDCKENYELIRELTSFSKELIVLSPEYIQKKVFERINSLSDEYKKILK